MKILIVEDEFVGRMFLQEILSAYGRCDVAINGMEAIESFKMALAKKDPYDVICLDIMMPDVDGQTVLKEIRKLEAENGIFGLAGLKIIMTTALGDLTNIKTAFKEQCDAYLIKPIMRDKLIQTFKDLGLISSSIDL